MTRMPRQMAGSINHQETLLCLQAEREFLRLLEGDCGSPVGVPCDHYRFQDDVARAGFRTAARLNRDTARVEGDSPRPPNWQGNYGSGLMAEKTRGKCFVVGAGPGDLGLVTLRAKQCIEQAEVIVYDYLCNPEMLRWAAEKCRAHFCRKKGGRPHSDAG